LNEKRTFGKSVDGNREAGIVFSPTCGGINFTVFLKVDNEIFSFNSYVPGMVGQAVIKASRNPWFKELAFFVQEVNIT
jgi:hypothetical protein